jgi:hypothetical protein
VKEFVSEAKGRFADGKSSAPVKVSTIAGEFLLL